MRRIFIINTVTAWHEPPRARHQLAFSLAKEHQVIFVARNETGRKRVTIKEISQGITLVTPYYPVDYRFRYRIPVVNEQYQDWLFSFIREQFHDIPVINFDFTAHRLFGYFKSVVYYCNDEYIGNSRYPNWFTNRYHAFCEDRVIRKSVFNVATSAYLTLKLSKLNPATYEMPLGVTPLDLPPDYTGIREPDPGKIRLGLLGVISKKQISVAILNEILENPRFSLVIIGPVEDSFLHALKNKGSIELKGVLKGQEMISALMEIDVGLAPYNLKRINPGATPNKLWQYLYVGKPLIISKMQNLDPAAFPPNSIYILDGQMSVSQLIHRAYNENSKEIAKARMEFAGMNTWDIRVEEFLVHVRQHLTE